ncbi:MAG: RNA ligase family protein [Bacteroidota bacterium]
MSDKYPRTYHLPFSPGATNDDRIAESYEQFLLKRIVITEKLDGENSCINDQGVFARSHGTVNNYPWACHLWDIWKRIHLDIGEMDIFGENLYAKHSIEYSGLEHYFYIFGIRDGSKWLSWGEVEFYAKLLNLPTAPVLYQGYVKDLNTGLENYINQIMSEPSLLSDNSNFTTPKEGVVIRLFDEFDTSEFSKSVIKWVRPNHVQTDEHWRKNWKRAKFGWELKFNRLK